MKITKLEQTAMYLTKSWGRTGKKGWAKKVAHQAIRRYGKALCRQGDDK